MQLEGANMAEDLPEIVLGSVDESRRTFLRRLIVSTAFVAPGVASFTMGGLGIGEAMANMSNLVCITSNLTNSAPVTQGDIGSVIGNYNNFDFTALNLTDTDFRGNSFVGTDFAGANLSNDLFACVNCANANFAGANLTYANFTDANLAGANFAGATISHAVFTGANVFGANFSGVIGKPGAGVI
jgi:uncharacterized protein YjbI with pentapeptide repeats